MTVILNAPYLGLRAGEIYTGSAEAQLVSSGLARPASNTVADFGTAVDPAELGNAVGVLGTRTYPVPAGFPLDQSKVGLQLYVSAGQTYGLATSAAALIPSGVWAASLAQTFHVDAINGNNSNTGIGAYYGDFSTAVADIATAITKLNATANPGKIIVNGANGSHFNRTLSGVAASNYLTVDAALISLGGRSTLSSAQANTWALDATYTNCYSAGQANCCGVIDLTQQRWLGDAQGSRLLDRQGAGRQAYGELTVFASAAALNTATASQLGIYGGWYNDGAKTYIRRADGGAVTDATNRAFRGVGPGAAPGFSTGTASSSKSLYIEGFEIQGGFLSTNAGTRNVWMNNCRLAYAGLNASAGTSSNGTSTDFIGVALYTSCEGWCCGADIFNPHGNNGAHIAVAIDCLGWDTGRGTSVSNNGITGHETCVVVDVNGDYQNCRGGTARFINNSRTLLYGTKIRNDLGDVGMGTGYITPTAVGSSDNAIVWVTFCDIQSDRALWTEGAAAKIYTFRNKSVVGTQTGGGPISELI